MFKTLKENRSFERIYKKGSSVNGAYVVLYALKNSNVSEDKDVFYGITVSKKVGKAVVRNRARRLIRESICSNKKYFDSNYSYVFVAKKRIVGLSCDKVCKNLRFVLKTFKKDYM